MEELEPLEFKKDNIQNYLVIVLWVLLFIMLCLYITKEPKTQTINEQRLELKDKAEITLSWTLKTRDDFQKKIDKLNSNIRVIQECIDGNSHTWFLTECNFLNKTKWKK